MRNAIFQKVKRLARVWQSGKQNKSQRPCFLVQHTGGWLASTRKRFGKTWLLSLNRASRAPLAQRKPLTCSACGSCPPTSLTAHLLQFLTWQSLSLRRAKALLQMASYGLPCDAKIATTAVTTLVQLSWLEQAPWRHGDCLLLSQSQASSCYFFTWVTPTSTTVGYG